MNVQLTFAVLTTLIALLVVLRLRWSLLSPRTRKLCIAIAITCLALAVLSMFTRWKLSYNPLNSLLAWTRDLSYVFLVLLFTLLRPRWLTSLIAVVLILPLYSTSIVLPLSGLFNVAPETVTNLGNHIYGEKTPFSYPHFASGVDIEVAYHPPWMPILKHRLAEARLFNSQCDASGTFAVVIDREPEPGRIEIHCPPWPDLAGEGDRIATYPLH